MGKVLGLVIMGLPTLALIVMMFLMPILTPFGATGITAKAYDLQEHYEKMRAKREQKEKEFMEKCSE